VTVRPAPTLGAKTDAANAAARAEEADVLRAIFADDAISFSDDGALFTYALPLPDGAVTLNVFLPPGYPNGLGEDARPCVEVAGVPRALRLEGSLEAILERCSGAPCLFEVVSFLRDRCCAAPAEGAFPSSSRASSSASAAGSGPGDFFEAARADAEADAEADAAARVSAAAASTIEVTRGPTFVERKSTFVAHVARVQSTADVESALAVILSDSRVARATHNIRAWRFRDARGALKADNDDDGEDAAGGRLAELLELMAVENVLVVVTRWFGGTLLGPSRFKIINNVARELIEARFGRGNKDKV